MPSFLKLAGLTGLLSALAPQLCSGYTFMTNAPELLSADFDDIVHSLLGLSGGDELEQQGVQIDAILTGNHDDQWVHEMALDVFNVDLSSYNASSSSNTKRKVPAGTLPADDVCAAPQCADPSDPNVLELQSAAYNYNLVHKACSTVEWDGGALSGSLVAVFLSGKVCVQGGQVGAACTVAVGWIAGISTAHGLGFIDLGICDTLVNDAVARCKTVGGEIDCEHKKSSGNEPFTVRETISTTSAAPPCPATRFGAPTNCIYRPVNLNSRKRAIKMQV